MQGTEGLRRLLQLTLPKRLSHSAIYKSLPGKEKSMLTSQGLAAAREKNRLVWPR